MPLQTNQSSLPNFTSTSLKNAHQKLIKLLENPVIMPDEEADNINNNRGSSVSMCSLTELFSSILQLKNLSETSYLSTRA